MGASQAATLNRLLDEALQLPAEQRLQWLDGLSAEYDPLKPRLRKLLERASAPERLSLSTLPKLEEPVNLGGAQAARAEGSRVGRYRLQRRLGIGGMGVVWLAADEAAPSERWVALKFAHVTPQRADLATRLARERQMLAALAHPNIARLYDAGMTDDQRLYLVLEYVEGLPLDQYCAERGADLGLRLALFVQIADALTHAHERRIVHRDLKPANVLVTAGGETKLLDFGVAKLLGDESFAHPQLSQLSGRPLTPAYASPEQIAGAEVGYPSDIYSLGVLLYELVTGSRPYRYKRGSNRATREAILEVKPLPPSVVVTEPELARALHGELDELILTALQKQPEQRFDSMRAFALRLEEQARLAARRRQP